MQVGPAVDGDGIFGQRPDEIAAPVEVVVERAGVAALLHDTHGFNREHLRNFGVQPSRREVAHIADDEYKERDGAANDQYSEPREREKFFRQCGPVRRRNEDGGSGNDDEPQVAAGAERDHDADGQQQYFECGQLCSPAQRERRRKAEDQPGPVPRRPEIKGGQLDDHLIRSRLRGVFQNDGIELGLIRIEQCRRGAGRRQRHQFPPLGRSESAAVFAVRGENGTQGRAVEIVVGDRRDAGCSQKNQAVDELNMDVGPNSEHQRQQPNPLLRRSSTEVEDHVHDPDREENREQPRPFVEEWNQGNDAQPGQPGCVQEAGLALRYQPVQRRHHGE